MLASRARIPHISIVNNGSCSISRISFALLAALFAQTLSGLTATNSLSPPPQARIYRDKFQPQWFADNTRFWYRVETGVDSHEFVLINVEAGSRVLAFDHQRLAAALIQAGVPEVSAERLPLSRLEFTTNLSSVRFRASGKNWDCTLTDY